MRKNVKYFRAKVYYTVTVNGVKKYKDDVDVYKVDLDKFYSSDLEEIELYIRKDLYGVAKAHYGKKARFDNFVMWEISESRYQECLAEQKRLQGEKIKQVLIDDTINKIIIACDLDDSFNELDIIIEDLVNDLVNKGVA